MCECVCLESVCGFMGAWVHGCVGTWARVCARLHAERQRQKERAREREREREREKLLFRTHSVASGHMAYICAHT